jgi:hypothetical protein
MARAYFRPIPNSLLLGQILQHILGMRGGGNFFVDVFHFAVFANHNGLPCASVEAQCFGQIAIGIGEECIWSVIGFFKFLQHVSRISGGAGDGVAACGILSSFITEAAGFSRSPAGECFREEENDQAFLVFER